MKHKLLSLSLAATLLGGAGLASHTAFAAGKGFSGFQSGTTFLGSGHGTYQTGIRGLTSGTGIKPTGGIRGLAGTRQWTQAVAHTLRGDAAAFWTPSTGALRIAGNARQVAPLAYPPGTPGGTVIITPTSPPPPTGATPGSVAISGPYTGPAPMPCIAQASLSADVAAGSTVTASCQTPVCTAANSPAGVNTGFLPNGSPGPGVAGLSITSNGGTFSLTPTGANGQPATVLQFNPSTGQCTVVPGGVITGDGIYQVVLA